MPYFALIYHTSPDNLERRAQYRADHLALARDAHGRGELLLGGAFQNPSDTALLVWKCADRTPIEAFVAADPYVKNGLVARYEIRDWKVVIADDPMPL
jgi:uncharacterized protein YciI